MPGSEGSDRLSADLASLRIARDGTSVAKAKKSNAGGVLVTVLAIAALAGVGVVGKSYVEAKVFKPEVALTEVSLVSPAQASVDLTATGYVVPQIVAKVGAKTEGRITKVRAREGDTVKLGEILFELDPSDQKSAILSAQARVAAARARAASARARAQAARANVVEQKQQLDRHKKLAASGAEPASEAEDSEARVKALDEQARAADVEASAADAEIAAAQAEVAALNVGLGNLTIAAPIDGTAMTKPVEVGDVVTPGMELIELADFNSLLVEVDVPEARLGQAKKGGPCEVVLDSSPDKRRRGEVVDVSPRLNRAKASGTVKVKILDASDDIRPEMAARVSFLQKALDAAQMKEPPKKIVPSDAIVDRAGAKVVFVYEDGKVRMQPVTLGAPSNGGFEVKDGPAPGTRLVKAPSSDLADGQAVKEKGNEG